MKQIIIESKKHGTKSILVDDEDFDLVSKYRWTLSKGPKTFYANCGSLGLHKLLIKSEFVDHINNNGLDNRRDNLRACTRVENNRNLSISKSNKTGFKGVSFDKKRNKYQARIGNNYKSICIGRFDKAVDAAKAYNEYAIKYYGEFAYLNVIPETAKINPCKYGWVTIVQNKTARPL